MRITKKTGNQIIDNLIYNMVYVEGGTFSMGSAPYDCKNSSEPVHEVTLSSFYIGKFQVTQKEWIEIMGNNPSEFVGSNNPVENVSWYDGEQFFIELNRRSSLNFYFPTEAQWEFAAKGGKEKGKGNRTYLYSGSDDYSEVAWCYYNSGDLVKKMKSEATWWKKATYEEEIMNNRTHPVGALRSNELGIYDMSGNVDEWCADWYEEYSPESSYNPQGPYHGNEKIFRGGNWRGCYRLCAVVNRQKAKLQYKTCTNGLRVALTV
jgi:formylglycine-generating enzyme required for sulfatase activity